MSWFSKWLRKYELRRLLGKAWRFLQRRLERAAWDIVLTSVMNGSLDRKEIQRQLRRQFRTISQEALEEAVDAALEKVSPDTWNEVDYSARP